MSRTVPENFLDRLKAEAQKPKPPGPITITIPLKTITPVVGGGVESMTPDTVDHVRVQGIRGQLRWWWRTLHPYDSAGKLFKEETRIWGGVGKGVFQEKALDEKSTKNSVDACESLVTVQALKACTGRLDCNPLSNCKGGNNAQTYTLFPLSVGKNTQKPTGIDKTFTLSLSFNKKLSPNDLKGIFVTVNLWILFSSIGARGTRGYGRFASPDSQHVIFSNNLNNIDFSALSFNREVDKSNKIPHDPLALFQDFRAKILTDYDCGRTQDGSPRSLGNFCWAFRQGNSRDYHQRLADLIKIYKDEKLAFHLKNDGRFTSPLRFGITYLAGEPFDYFFDTGERPPKETLKNPGKDPRKTYSCFFKRLKRKGWTLIGPGGSHDV